MLNFSDAYTTMILSGFYVFMQWLRRESILLSNPKKADLRFLSMEMLIPGGMAVGRVGGLLSDRADRLAPWANLS
jgi:hypothetical protein